MSAKTEKTGRKNLYSVKVKPHLKDIEAWAAAGWTEAGMRRALDVDSKTWIEYKQANPDMQEALWRGMAEADRKVVNALFKRACGYNYQETGHNGEVVTKHQPGDVAAQIFWLCNRDSDNWKNRQIQQITGKDGGPVEVGLSEALQHKLEKLAGDPAK